MSEIEEFIYANMHDGQRGGRMTVSVDDHVRETAEVVAEYLSGKADLDDVLDRSSSASRQHFVDTGRFLFHGEAESTFPQTPEEAITCPHGNKVWFGHECGECGA